MGAIKRISTVFAGIVLVVLAMIWMGNRQDHANDPQKLEVAVSDQDWFEGGKDASVVLVEYSDFQCPACGAYYPIVKGLHDAYGDKLKIVYRNYPLTEVHPNAQIGAQAAEAAGLQGKFFEYHDMLFLNQKAWSLEEDPTGTLTGYAKTLGLDEAKFTSDLTSDAVKKSVKEDLDGGTKSNIQGTPTFFINGFKIENPNGLEPFKTLIDNALNPTDSTSSTPASSQQ